MNVVSHKHLPINPFKTVYLAVLAWLVLDRLDAGGVWYGIVFTVIVVLFLLSLLAVINEEHKEPKWKE